MTCMLGDVWTIAHSRRHLSVRASSLWLVFLPPCLLSGTGFVLSQRQLPGFDRNGVFTEAARYGYHLSRVWANGVLDFGDGFRVLNPLGFFTEAVRCDNCEARCTHEARARTQEPNLPRAADNLHVCGLSLHYLARRSRC